MTENGNDTYQNTGKLFLSDITIIEEADKMKVAHPSNSVFPLAPSFDSNQRKAKAAAKAKVDTKIKATVMR